MSHGGRKALRKREKMRTFGQNGAQGMVSELIDKYIWLVQTFIDAGPEGLSLEEISRKWTNRYGGTEYPRRSFNNHRQAVAEVFGIEIACNRSTNRYYIDDGESAVDGRESVNWLINTFTVNNLLSLGTQGVHPRGARQLRCRGRSDDAGVPDSL